MPPLTLRIVACVIALCVAAALLIGPAIAPAASGYQSAVKVFSGTIAAAGSLCLTRAVSQTLLRSGGTRTFNAAYLAATALGGLGLAEAASAVMPGNISYSLAACCIASTASGALWMKFYGRYQ
ncbi:MAG TPA: hypothetical protein VLT35_00015 [Methanocella sp.]|nr:hypothetical protein [Methanocella sp.]